MIRLMHLGWIGLLGTTACLALADDRATSLTRRPQQQQPRVPNAKPQLSPYINLLNSNADPGFLYAGIIKPQIDNQKFQKQQVEQIGKMNKEMSTDVSKIATRFQQQQMQLQQLQTGRLGAPGAPMPAVKSSSHRGGFMNRSKYFPGAGGS